MPETSYLTNHFLIAMPSLADPNFHQTVTYICEHTSEGAMGIVINRTLDLDFEEIIGQLDLEAARPEIAQIPIYDGGPVQLDRGFVLHKPVGDWDSSLKITDQIALTTSMDIIKAIANDEGPEELLIALGYAGWGAGQLEREMSENAWLSGPANEDILFHAPIEQRWKRAALGMGVDLDRLSTDAGHA